MISFQWRTQMKKTLLGMLLAAAFAGNANAYDFHWGAGVSGDFGWNFTTLTPEGGGTTKTALETMTGVTGFVDTYWLEGHAGMAFFTPNEKASANSGLAGSLSQGIADKLYMSLGLYVKFPLDYGRFSFYPLLGFNSYLYLKNDGALYVTVGGNNVEVEHQDYFDFTELKAGFGVDFFPHFYNRFYVRTQALWSLRLPWKLQEQIAPTASYDVFTHGPAFRIMAGYLVNPGARRSATAVRGRPAASGPAAGARSFRPLTGTHYVTGGLHFTLLERDGRDDIYFWYNNDLALYFWAANDGWWYRRRWGGEYTVSNADGKETSGIFFEHPWANAPPAVPAPSGASFSIAGKNSRYSFSISPQTLTITNGEETWTLSTGQARVVFVDKGGQSHVYE
jgi:hypothetical protein